MLLVPSLTLEAASLTLLWLTIVTVAPTVVAAVVTGNVCSLLPPLTVTDAGTVTLALFEEITTGVPCADDGPFIFKVPVVPFPDTTVEGFSERDVTTGAVITKDPELVDAPNVAVICVD